MRLPDKTAVREALEAALERALETMVNAARTTREGAIHEDSRAEGDKDMRSTEQSYLARGQAMRVEELAEQLQRLRTATSPSSTRMRRSRPARSCWLRSTKRRACSS